MYHDPYGFIYMAFGAEVNSSNTMTNHDGDGLVVDYAPKIAVGGFNGSTGAKVFYHHMEKYFGEVYAITYVDFGPTGSNVYVGGSVNTCYFALGGPSSCWELTINRLTPSGFNESQR